MKSKKFFRQDYMRHLKLGKKRKKLQKWRKPKGRHSKMREKRKGYPNAPGIGYKIPKSEIKTFTLINNLKDLNKPISSQIILSGKLGAKKRIEIIKKASSMRLKIHNIKSGEAE